MKRFFLWMCCLPALLWGQTPKSPLEKMNYERPVNYTELSEYMKALEGASPLLKVETIGQTVEGRNLYALKFSSSTFGKDKSKLKVLIFAQQHGNEQSGKDGVLLLIGELLKPENRYLFDHVDFALIPQANPDGSEKNQRRNGHNADMNRNHLILEEPEVQALHRFYDRYLFDVTMDVHEYAPYFSDEWKKYGYRTNSDETIGCNTNCNISSDIRNFSNQVFVPFYRDYLKKRKITTALYAPGGPPEIDYIRHSTYDINDGRQSFGIQGSLSFIQEGLNGEDMFKDRIKQRAIGQMTGMRALLEFSYRNVTRMKSLVETARKDLLSPKFGSNYAIQMKHVRTGAKLELPLYSYSTGHDTVVVVNDYRPLVKSFSDVSVPVGYLIPKSIAELTDWVKRQNLRTSSFASSTGYKLVQYQVESIGNIDFEGDTIVSPNVKSIVLNKTPNLSEYIFIPVAQLKGRLAITALEPKSELGLVTYSGYSHLLKANQLFPVIRVEK